MAFGFGEMGSRFRETIFHVLTRGIGLVYTIQKYRCLSKEHAAILERFPSFGCPQESEVNKEHGTLVLAKLSNFYQNGLRY